MVKNSREGSQLALVLGVAFLWGMLDATVFFIVPGVLLSAIALRSFPKALLASFCALIGALIGAIALYFWAANYPATAETAITYIPGIDEAMLFSAQTYLVEGRLLMPSFSILMGTPIKLYITAGGLQLLGLGTVLGLTLPALFVRFVLVSALFWCIGKYLWTSWSLRAKSIAHALFWIVFYAVFFITRAVVTSWW